MKIKLKNAGHKVNKNFTIMLIPYSNGRPRKLVIPYFTLHTIAICIAFLLFLCVSFYLIANNFKVRTASAEIGLHEAIQINNELVRQETLLSGAILEEKNRADRVEEEVSKSYEDRIKYYEEKSAEFQQRIDELNRLKNEISDKISSTIDPINDDFAYNDADDEQVLSFNGESDGETLAVGGPASGDYLDWAFSKLETDITNQEMHYSGLIEKIYSSSINEKGVQTALDNGVLRENIPTIWPADGQITSWFGNRLNPFGGKGEEGHNGIDIAVNTGTPVKAAGGGIVSFAGMYGSYGYLVVIDHGNGLQTYYGHNSSLKVSEGQTVRRGQVISLSGNTGRSTGPHVHFEVRLAEVVTNPLDYVK